MLLLSPNRTWKRCPSQHCFSAWSNLVSTHIRFSILFDSIRQLCWKRRFITAKGLSLLLFAWEVCGPLPRDCSSGGVKGLGNLRRERGRGRGRESGVGEGEGTLSLMLPFQVIEFVCWIHRTQLQQENLAAQERLVFTYTATGNSIITLHVYSLWQCLCTVDHRTELCPQTLHPERHCGSSCSSSNGH